MRKRLIFLSLAAVLIGGKIQVQDTSDNGSSSQLLFNLNSAKAQSPEKNGDNDCVTVEEFNELSNKVEQLQSKITELEQQLSKRTATGAANQAEETEAQNMLKEVQDLMTKNDITGAKAKLVEMGKKYSHTRTYRRAQKLNKELEVFGKDAPSSLSIDEWYTGYDGVIDLEEEATLIVFWEVWCPHSKKEIPNLQKIFKEFSPKGLQMIGLTKLSRSSTKEKVREFIYENEITYPMAKENGEMSKYFNVSGIPAAAFIKDGTIVWRGHPARITVDMLNSWL
jgi:thiol-disulfide isomerase/thioredoxin